MRIALSLVLVATTTSIASADFVRESDGAGIPAAKPAAGRPGAMLRFGLTYGVDRNAPEAREVGPMIAIGTRAGRFGAEANYTYLSFADPDDSVHRAGVALRFDLIERTRLGAGLAEDHYGAIYAEVGAAIRFGEWRANPAIDRTTTRQDELQLALGHELEDRWHIALRFGIAREDPLIGAACRGTGSACTDIVMDPDAGGVAESLMLESTFALGL
jgi:hypothetical protein